MRGLDESQDSLGSIADKRAGKTSAGNLAAV